ncbi:MAG TPA: hypothetical protein VM620_13330 [Hyphomicrobium sp.]|jgi:hypothetical protein|nr:hypothetical protein [Hyphomicrobium sp.]
MGISVAGVLVFGLLAILGWALGSPLIIGLMTSLAFGSTAIGTVGGSTPLLFTAFEMLIVASLALRPSELRSLPAVMRRHWTSGVMLALGIYVVGGAILIPRLFAGRVVVPGVVGGYSADVLLQPVPGNFNQACYFAMGVAVFFALSVRLLDVRNLEIIRRGFFAFAAVNAALGILDILGKIVGISDILLPIRTAAYTMHTATSVGGFWRIAGGHPEASAFASVTFAALAFCLSYWRASGTRLALWLTLISGGLLVLSTSSTAYGSLGILSVFLGAEIAYLAVKNRFKRRDAALLGVAAVGVVAIVCFAVFDPRIIDPFVDFLYSAIWDKAQSASGIERAYWNERSMDAFMATSGIGIGLGSARASSWLVAVLSQLGVIGFSLIGVLTVFIVYGMRGVERNEDTMELITIANSVRASALASLAAFSLVGGNADPGVIFVIAVAVIAACRLAAFRHASLKKGQENGYPPLAGMPARGIEAGAS